MEINKDKRIALVTGGSRGIGRAVCEALAKKGMNIVICYAHNQEEAINTLELCQSYGVTAMALKTNVASSEDVAELFAKIKETYGRLDVLVNNAGITRDNLILRMKEEEFDEVINTNLKGAYLCTKEAANLMLKQRYGRIINISSIVGINGNAGQANYAASKAGVIAMAKSISKELGSRNITANVVAPGFIETDMTAQLPEEAKNSWKDRISIKRLGKAEDIANAVSFFASEESGYITGQVLCVDGGM